MLSLILSSLYFLLPAYVANMCPVIFGKLPIPKKPISPSKLGQNKTYFGFVIGYLGAFAALYLQFYLQKNGTIAPPHILDSTQSFQYIETFIDYQKISLPLYAALFGLGALTGDSIKSCFKRKRDIPSGQPWFPFDQLDLVIGALLFLSPLIIPPYQVILTLLILTPLLHFLTNVLGYALGLKKVWW